MWLRIFFCCLFYLIIRLAWGQGDKPYSLKNDTENVILGTFGTFAPAAFYGSVTAGYERRLVKFRNPNAGTLWIRVGYGVWAAWLASGPHFITGFTYLAFQGASHLEFSLGYTSVFDKQGYEFQVEQSVYLGEPEPPKSEFRENLPAAAFGYRYQKMDGHFVFRIGISYPEGAYGSIGAAF